jgi:Arm domain-containing DNA-binding protein
MTKGLDAPLKGNRIYYDDRLKCFGLRITSAGKRAFILNYRIKGRERRMTIGSYPGWSVLAARKRAEELRREVDFGNDPLEARAQSMKASTIHDLFERYVRDHLTSKSTSSQIGDLSMWKTKILPASAQPFSRYPVACFIPFSPQNPKVLM